MNAPPATLPLLLEVGCEEIPARFLARAQLDLGSALERALSENRLLRPSDGVAPSTGSEVERMSTYSTPRRLVAYAPTILECQPDVTEQVQGPSVKVGFDKGGKPTLATESFAAKNGVRVEDLHRVTTPKGEYLAVKKTTRGRPALEVLHEALPGVITGLSFPKSMYWEASKVRFVRPIRWIVALLGEREAASAVPFEIAGVPSGNFTHGHPAFSSDAIRVTGFATYARELREHGVEFDPEMRRQRVREEVKAALEGISVIPDPDLEDWIVNSTEWPRALGGDFDARFLKLPREVLITVMRDHQKYFAVEDRAGKLEPRFVTVLNREGDPQGLIRKGHERVLAARFADAEFFWNADQRIPLRDRVTMLEKVTYQAKLGSYGHKVKRMEKIAAHGNALTEQGSWTAVSRAVHLCKCDLTTQMVQEFTELQGVVGGLYAREQGEPSEVSCAIYDHYKPLSLDDECPRTSEGALVSLADKFDTVLAGFSAGLEPTGSSDPFGLRRAGNGVVKVAAEKLSQLHLVGLVEAVESERLGLPFTDDLSGRVCKFLGERVEHYLREVAGLRYDTTRAVVHSVLGWAQPADARLRGVALEEIRDSEDFTALALAAKRTRNILAKSANIDYSLGIDKVQQNLLVDPEEVRLFNCLVSMQGTLADFEQKQKYEAAFRALATLRPPIDDFFDCVHVMDERPEYRNNRLTLVNSLHHSVFWRLADLSQIESKALSDVGASTS